jgi:hypothetical protein
MARNVNLFNFIPVADILCIDENECKNLHRLSNVILKRYYINDFGGPAIPNFPYNEIMSLYRGILRYMRKPSKSPNPLYLDMMNFIDEKYCIAKEKGQIYIIDNVKTVKVGASHNAITRFRELKANGEIDLNARLMWIYDVPDMYGFEALAHALLNQWKTQNPIYSSNRAVGWRYA